jgi:hypothetical protein
MAQDKGMKPYVKLAYALVGIGMGLFALERLGLSQLNGLHPHFAGWLITAMVVIPVGLVIAGCAVFMFGKVRRL